MGLLYKTIPTKLAQGLQELFEAHGYTASIPKAGISVQQLSETRLALDFSVELTKMRDRPQTLFDAVKEA